VEALLAIKEKGANVFPSRGAAIDYFIVLV
jgi:hypothetical protein